MTEFLCYGFRTTLMALKVHQVNLFLYGLFLDNFLERIKPFIVPGDVQDLMHLRINFKGLLRVKGGAINDEQRKDLSNKNSLITIKNNGNSCS